MIVAAQTVPVRPGTYSEPRLATALTHCPECHTPRVTYQVWESRCERYEALLYTCAACGWQWLIDRIDS